MSFKGKAIYNPSGKVGEYSYWACNFYVGCSNGCKYCYLKKGIGKSVLGGDKPTLKKCFKDEDDALEIFGKELLQNVEELRKHGLFFTFTSDPMLPETINLTKMACSRCVRNDVPIKILTKRIEFADKFIALAKSDKANGKRTDWIKLYAIGFTLTGHDGIEPNASTNAERIEAMRKLHEAGFRTWASIEPIIDLQSSMQMIEQTIGFCDLYKIGLESGKKLPKEELRMFSGRVNILGNRHGFKVYWKDSVTKITGKMISDTVVGRDYNMF